MGVAPILPDMAAREARLAGVALRYRAPLLRYFRRRGLGAVTAEDDELDVFVRLSRADQATVENAEAYLFAIAASVVIDGARRRRARREDRHDPIDSVVLPVGEITPAHVFEGRDELLRLAAALEDLPEKTRSIFLHNRLDGLSYTQLAARHTLSVSMIEKHISKALAHIRRRVQRDD